MCVKARGDCTMFLIGLRGQLGTGAEYPVFNEFISVCPSRFFLWFLPKPFFSSLIIAGIIACYCTGVATGTGQKVCKLLQFLLPELAAERCHSYRLKVLYLFENYNICLFIGHAPLISCLGVDILNQQQIIPVRLFFSFSFIPPVVFR